MTQQRERAIEIAREMFDPGVVDRMQSTEPGDHFGAEFTGLAFEIAYEKLWSRPGLGLRDRSLVTIAMLIAIGNDRELAAHLTAGMRNGLSVTEIQEIVYHATAYVGFPLASGALTIAAKAVAAAEAK